MVAYGNRVRKLILGNDREDGRVNPDDERDRGSLRWLAAATGRILPVKRFRCRRCTCRRAARSTPWMVQSAKAESAMVRRVGVSIWLSSKDSPWIDNRGSPCVISSYLSWRSVATPPRGFRSRGACFNLIARGAQPEAPVAGTVGLGRTTRLALACGRL
jgi:hypothetical protein